MRQKPKIIHTDKPWGAFTQYVLNSRCTVKILTCNPGQELSLQRHKHRDELWIVIEGDALIELNGDKFCAHKGAEIWLPAGSIHKFSCYNMHIVRILEISFGTFDENDIERLADIYGRL